METRYPEKKYEYIYPFIGKLIDLLIQNNNDYLETVLKRVIIHNREIYYNLKKLISDSINDCVEREKEGLKY